MSKICHIKKGLLNLRINYSVENCSIGWLLITNAKIKQCNN
nr:MAG TPA: hypothetical protein [Caudoviricetes sp.]